MWFNARSPRLVVVMKISSPSSLLKGPKRFGLGSHLKGHKGLWLVEKLPGILGMAALVSGGATWAVLAGFWGPTEHASSALTALLNLDIALLLVLSALILHRVVGLWLQRRRGGAGSQLHLRLVGLFGALSVIPAILMAAFSAIFFNLGAESWFSQRVQTALSESQAVAQAYLEEHRQVVAAQALIVAGDIKRNWTRLLHNPADQSRYLRTQISLRGLTEAILFDSSGRVAARAGYTLSLHFDDVPLWALEKAERGQVAVLTGDNNDRVRALVHLDTLPTMFLYVGRFVDTAVIEHIQQTDQAVKNYNLLQSGRSDLEIRFSVVFVVVSLLLLLAAVWMGFSLANRWAQPIAELITASGAISEGNMSVRVVEQATSDEVFALSKAFNRMAERITDQQSELITTNRRLEERKQFTETVLAGVSAGVISVSPDGNITLINRSAQTLLDLPTNAPVIGKPLHEVITEFHQVLKQHKNMPEGRSAQQEIIVQRGPVHSTFLVKVSAEYIGHELKENVITFDDITLLQAAQKTAAWADVARRIAHEIKNPLTPIQLSAERLKRRYTEQISHGQDVFVQCIETIVRHVEDIGGMVDEFATFAQMPTPVIKTEDICTLARQYIVIQKTAFPSIRFTMHLPSQPVWLACDARQIGQVLANLVKNSVEAIEAKYHGQEGGTIDIHLEDGQTPHHPVRFSVADNGKGFPSGNRASFVEPYVTTRARGTGLGLAIVKKILEDHKADLILGDNASGGACVSVLFTQPSHPVNAGETHRQTQPSS